MLRWALLASGLHAVPARFTIAEEDGNSGKRRIDEWTNEGTARFLMLRCDLRLHERREDGTVVRDVNKVDEKLTMNGQSGNRTGRGLVVATYGKFERWQEAHGGRSGKKAIGFDTHA